MLERAADPQGNVNLGLDGLAGCPHLTGFLQPLGIDDRARAGNNGTDRFGQFLGNPDILLIFDTAAYGYQYVGFGDFLQSWLFHESEFIWREGTNLNLIKNVWIALETCFFIPNKDIG